MTRRILPYLLVLLLGFSSSALAQRWLQFASGTGFYINRNGDLITNQHVVHGCQSIYVRTPQGDQPATLVAADEQRDLAILRTQSVPPNIAPMRLDVSNLKVGDPLYVYGFPGEAGANGKATFLSTTLSADHGPTGQQGWLQMAAASQQGNSGGPVLDGSGNVIAVIFGRAEIYETARNGAAETPKLVGSSGVAITLAVLQDFLREHMAGYYESGSGTVVQAPTAIARNAGGFTFPVICMQGTITR